MYTDKTRTSLPENRKQLKIAFIIYVLYVAVIFIANLLMRLAQSSGNGMYEELGDMLLGFFAIPVLSVILPFLLARKWQLPCSLWPKDKPWGLVVAVVFFVYMYFGFREPIVAVFCSEISLADFIVHFISTSLFHIPYYPLFLIFIFPVVRNNFGLFWGVLITALAFSLYHCSQFYNFPAGLTMRMQTFFVAEFVLVLMLYLWGQSIIILAVAHAAAGAFDLAANDFISSEIDFVFVIALLVSVGTLAYMVWRALGEDKRLDYDWWPRL